MSIREDALAYLRGFRRALYAPREDGYYERRAEAMRRARAVGCTYVAMGEAVGVGPERAKQIIVKALDAPRRFLDRAPHSYASGKGAIRLSVKRNDGYVNPGQDVTRRP